MLIVSVYAVSLAGPLPPQNITVGSITANRISIHWMLPNAQCEAGWTFVVQYEDMSSRQERVLTTISRVPVTGRFQSFTAVLEGLESYRQYRVEVFTVTKQGVRSCGLVPLTLQTGKHGLELISVTILLCEIMFW